MFLTHTSFSFLRSFMYSSESLLPMTCSCSWT